MPNHGPNDVLAAMRDYLARFDAARLRGFLDGFDWTMPVRDLPPNCLACTRQLPRLAELAPARERELVETFRAANPSLRWGQTYTPADFGQAFIDNYGWVELFGTRGHFQNDAIAGGFLILGPNLHYPDHHHVAEEIYIPLTRGALWRMGAANFRERAAGEVIFHASNVSHAMKTETEPLLALYLWRGGDLAQRPAVTGTA